MVYCALAAEFLTRYTQDRPTRSARAAGDVTRGVMDRPLKHMLYAMFIMSIFIVIRYDCLLFLRLPHPNDLQNCIPGSRIRGWVGWQG